MPQSRSRIKFVHKSFVVATPRTASAPSAIRIVEYIEFSLKLSNKLYDGAAGLASVVARASLDVWVVRGRQQGYIFEYIIYEYRSRLSRLVYKYLVCIVNIVF